MFGVQPLLLMGSLMALVLVYSMFIYWSVNCFWFSYLLMLVMLSGVLVIFSYMLSLSPNSEFESSNKSIVVAVFFVCSMGGEFYPMVDYSLMSNQLWMNLLKGATMWMLVFLLGVMVMIVWLSMIGEGSLRELLCAWLKG